ncbi:MAG: cache domain-containing protein, partial [Pseudomonadota bacterium]
MEYVSFLHVWYRRALNPVLVACIASLALGLLLFPRIEGTFIRRNVDESTATLRVVADGINQLTQRYEPVPELIAERPLLVQVLKDPGNSGLVPYVNEQLRLTAQAIDASDIFLLDPTGLTVAASNYRRAHSFIGNRFDYRPYFQEAVSGRSSQFHALGTTSGERGFFFAAPVLDGVTVRGVLAVKVQVNDIEMGWDGLTKDIAIADPNGVIFLSNREDLHFRTLAPLSEEVLKTMEATRQFPLNLIQPLPTQADVIDDDAVSIEFTTNDGKESFLVESYPLAKPGWHAIALSPYAPVRTNALYVLLVWCLIVLVLSLAAMVFQQRRARFKERMEIQRRERDLLEQRVQDRTAELNKANRELQIEIEERKATEESLRRKKNELIQAGKLAALGQMSAAISHEINQPLSAVLSYADNAAAYLDRGRADEARKNITHISDMADRMARISKHLRNFARRPGDQLSSVEICSVIDEAISLSEPQLKRRNAVVRFER